MSLGTHDLVQAIGRVNASMDRLSATLAAQLEIGVTDLRALYIVHVADQVSAKDVGAALGITSGSTTPLVDRLVQRGFMRRTDHPTDRRSTLLKLTPAGHHAVAWFIGYYDAAVSTAIDSTDEAEDLERLNSQLERINSALEQTTAAVAESAGTTHPSTRR